MKTIKKIILTLIISGAILACNKNDDDETKQELSGNWKLTQMTGNTPNSTTTGSDMTWQETYSLDSDGTFTKTRTEKDITIQEKGTYNLDDSQENKSLTLTYNKENTLIANCSQNLIETMIFEDDNVFYSTWNACDGAGLKYEKED